MAGGRRPARRERRERESCSHVAALHAAAARLISGSEQPDAFEVEPSVEPSVEPPPPPPPLFLGTAHEHLAVAATPRSPVKSEGESLLSGSEQYRWAALTRSSPPLPPPVAEASALSEPLTINVTLTGMPLLVGGIVVGSLCSLCLLLLCVRWILGMRRRKLAASWHAVDTQEPTSGQGRATCRFKRWPSAPSSRPSPKVGARASSERR